MPKNTENTNLRIIIYSSPDMQASSAGTVAGPSLCLPRAAGGQRPLPGLLGALRREGHLGLCSRPQDCAALYLARGTSLRGQWLPKLQCPPHPQPVSMPVETLWAPASEEAGAWESAFQEGAGLPLRALHIPRVPSPGPHSQVAGASVLSVAASISFSQSEHSVGPVGRSPASIP